MPKVIKVYGGRPLVGDILPVPNKNAMLAALPACILTDETVCYKNLGMSSDVVSIFKILELLGAEIDQSDLSNIKINCAKLNSYKVDMELGNSIRSSIMLAGPLLARFGVVEIPVPGGCILGKRSIAAHIDVFTKVGVKVEYLDKVVRLTAPSKPVANQVVWQFEASVTATENLLMYAAGVESEITLIDAACEPHVTQLANLLVEMGAKIEGISSNKLAIKGSKNLKGAEFEPWPDQIDIAGEIVAAAVTGGKLKILNANVAEISGGIIQSLEKFGIKIEKVGKDLLVDGSGEIKIDPKNSGFPMAGNNLPKFLPRPWPGFPVDALPPVVTLACKNQGDLMVQNWMYESGLDFIRELNNMGANILICDPQRVVVSGPVKFSGGVVTPPGVIQAHFAILLAALADPVETTISGVEVLSRRYPDLLETYNKLGAKIEVIG